MYSSRMRLLALAGYWVVNTNRNYGFLEVVGVLVADATTATTVSIVFVC
jgi:hypothetical protein